MNNKVVWVLLIVLFFIAGAAGSYFFLKHFETAPHQPLQGEEQMKLNGVQDFIVIRLFLPKEGVLEMTERKLPRRTNTLAVAEAVVEEFFRSSGNGTGIPQNVKLLGLYRDMNQVIYLDLSDELRRNFQGDALAEYLVLKAIFESFIANVQDFQDLKILVEGKETETLGGHFFLNYPLKNIVQSELKMESKSAHE